MIRLPRTLPLLGALISLIALGACSKSGGVSNEIPAQSLAEAQELARHSQVFCENDAECSPSVGLIATAEPQRATVCTGSLVAEDVVATASHCIPQDLGKGADCGGRIWISFPDAEGFPSARIECSRILDASRFSAPYRINRDYAFFRLQKPASRPALEIRRSGFQADTSYSLFLVDPFFGSGQIEGSLRKQSCVAIHGSEYLPGSYFERSPIMTFKDCQVGAGNSGSPIVDAQGSLLGVLQAIPNPSDEKWLEFTRKAALDQPGVSIHLAFGTNYACVRTPFDSASTILDADDASCEQDMFAQPRLDQDPAAIGD